MYVKPIGEEVKNMKYETPQLTALEAINTVQSHDSKAQAKHFRDSSGVYNESQMSYADWE